MGHANTIANAMAHETSTTAVVAVLVWALAMFVSVYVFVPEHPFVRASMSEDESDDVSVSVSVGEFPDVSVDVFVVDFVHPSRDVTVDEVTVTLKRASSDVTAKLVTAIASLRMPRTALLAILNFMAMALLYHLAAAIANFFTIRRIFNNKDISSIKNKQY